MSELSALLDAPCIFCGYNGPGYWQAGMHGKECPWHSIGGSHERAEALPRVARDAVARLAELEGKLYRARDAVAAAGQREAWMVEVLTHAETWMSEDGCDCGTDEPGTCALCEAQAIISSPRSPTAQALARLVEAARGWRVWRRAYLNAPGNHQHNMRVANETLGDAVDAYQAARSGRGEGQP